MDGGGVAMSIAHAGVFDKGQRLATILHCPAPEFNLSQCESLIEWQG
jgi:hypothetical protein